jgi:hypothetical protein
MGKASFPQILPCSTINVSGGIPRIREMNLLRPGRLHRFETFRIARVPTAPSGTECGVSSLFFTAVGPLFRYDEAGRKCTTVPLRKIHYDMQLDYSNYRNN